MEFTTFNDLERWAGELGVQGRTTILKESRTKASKNTFLSHSSKDAEHLPAVIKLLEGHGASVYCDLADNRLPENPNPETARILKQQIKSSKRLVVFVTVNSKDSKWVPWELGIGDVSLTESNVALLPVSNSSYEQAWAKQEYLGIYRHIVHGNMDGESKPLWMVYDFRANTATKLSTWCRSG